MPPIQLSAEQEQNLIGHAAALHLPLLEALDALLQSPPARPTRPWTEEELNLLRNPRNRPADLARRLRRSVSAVSNRRSILARQENLPELQRAPRPSQLQARQLAEDAAAAAEVRARLAANPDAYPPRSAYARPRPPSAS